MEDKMLRKNALDKFAVYLFFVLPFAVSGAFMFLPLWLAAPIGFISWYLFIGCIEVLKGE